MRRALLSLTAVVMLLAALPSAGAAPADTGVGYFSSGNVTLVKNVPLHADGAGGRIVGEHFYVTDSRALTIYDISDPLNPNPLSVLPLPQTPYFAQEDVNTNGKILLITSSIGRGTSGLYVIDVRDKANPQIVATLAGVHSHTTSCVLDCTWAYNSNGQIIDLRDPTNPKLAGDWRAGTGVSSAHDVTEVAPGWVMTSSTPFLLLDASVNPAKPTLIRKGSPKTARYMHGNLWPRDATDKYALFGSEKSGNCVDNGSASFMTFSTPTRDSEGKLVGEFEQIDEYALPTGLYTDGLAPYDTFCTHWFDPHPTRYADGGLVAISWYEHGTRFLNVDRDTGKISEVGWIIPWATSASAPYWVTDDLLYVVDYQRGLDIVRFTHAG